MKSLYLILAATAVAVTSEPQRTNNDIIWYPVDGEEGVFISTVGEKHRTSHETKWRSHRRARYSGTPLPLPLSFDPADNQDPSFFHNIHERRPGPFVRPFPEVPPVLQSQQFPVMRPDRRPQGPSGSNFPENSFQEIINEVFDYKLPPASELPGTTNKWGSWSTNYPTNNQQQWGNGIQQPASSGQNQWGNGVQPPTSSGQNQWGNGVQPPTSSGQNQWGNGVQPPTSTGQNQWGNNVQKPSSSGQNQWGNLIQQPAANGQNQWGNGVQPPTSSGQNQWGNGVQPPTSSGQNQWGNGVQGPISSGNKRGTSSSSLENSFPGQRPTTGAPNTRPQKRPSSTGRPIKRPIKESDKLVFPGETSETTTTSLDLIPTEAPTMSPCERKCPVTPEFNPVCGSDGVTYSNAGRLKCSRMCGKDVTLSHHGNCGRTPLVTPLVSNNRRRELTMFL